MNKMLSILEERFHYYKDRHAELTWAEVASALEKAPSALDILERMEETGGHPDVLWADEEVFWFYDCVLECPAERKSLCYDEEAWASRKKNKPRSSVAAEVAKIGSTWLTEEDYFTLQNIQPCDLKTSCWLKTPTPIRQKGGAIFGDRRFGRVFVYHNGVESYYRTRGFRTKLGVPRPSE